jgi:hypothetical protein
MRIPFLSVSHDLKEISDMLFGSSQRVRLGCLPVSDWATPLFADLQVDRVLRKKSGENAKELLHRRELNSITAEFSLRVRLDHPNLVRTNLAALIKVDGVQKVRVTGILIFDSEHSPGKNWCVLTTGRYIPCWPWSIASKAGAARQR